jgi:hypothetical protein
MYHHRARNVQLTTGGGLLLLLRRRPALSLCLS